MIEMQDIVKQYTLGGETIYALDHISLRVEKGEYVTIIGPSGSGKSTLMNLIGCLDTADSGSYLLNGKPIRKYRERQLAEVRSKQIGFIFQKYQLIPKYSVIQNVIMPLLVRGMTSRKAKQQCMDTLNLLGLSERLSHKPSELSGGQQQRVAIARALVGHPAILLADEPTGALDSNTGKEVLALFKQLNEMGNTIIMITHDLNVASHAKRIVRIVDGELFYS